MEHIRKEIPGFSNYQACSCGKIYTKHRKRYLKAHLSPMTNKLVLNLKNDDGKHRTVTASRILVRAFVQPNLTLSQLVQYRDEDPENLNLDNLVVMHRTEFAHFYHRFDGSLKEYLNFYKVIKNNPQAA